MGQKWEEDAADVDYLLQLAVPDGRGPDEALTRNVSRTGKTLALLRFSPPRPFLSDFSVTAMYINIYTMQVL